MVSPGTCGWIFNCCMPAIIFSKKNSKYEILNHLYFGPSFLFCGTALGRFSQCWIFHLSSLANHFGRYLYAPPPNHRKAFYGTAEKCKTTNKLFIHVKPFVLLWKSTSFSLRKIFQNMAFLCPVFSNIRIEFSILSLYG